MKSWVMDIYALLMAMPLGASKFPNISLDLQLFHNYMYFKYFFKIRQFFKRIQLNDD